MAAAPPPRLQSLMLLQLLLCLSSAVASLTLIKITDAGKVLGLIYQLEPAGTHRCNRL